ncbi:MAG TPA: membrane protein [Lactobacillus sp.]|nr:membrane protein [Lactobacillus sp.]
MTNIESTNTQPHQNKIISVTMKTLMSFFGIAILSLGTTFLREGQVGLDPFTALNTGMAAKFGLSLGTYQLAANLVIFVFIIILDRKKIGIGTVLNMVLVGYEIQWFSSIYKTLLPGSVNLFSIIADAIVGLLLFTLGASLYMTADLGVAPYDAIAPIASDRLHIQYRIVRIIQDVLFMLAAVLAGGPVGIATIIVAFFTGPLITYWNTHVSQHAVTSINRFSTQPNIKGVGTEIVELGRVSYSAVSHAYKMTVHTQQRLSGYSNAELTGRLNATKTNLDNAKQIYDNMSAQYEMLKNEAQRRHDENEEKK